MGRLLLLPVLGCEDIELPTNVWTERVDDDRMTVHCNSTPETWYLTCRDNRWIGDSPFNCTVDRDGTPTPHSLRAGERTSSHASVGGGGRSSMLRGLVLRMEIL